MRKKQDFYVQNNLDTIIKYTKNYRIENNIPNFLEKDIINELCAYCSIGSVQIVKIKRNIAQPSLGVAILIAKFFNITVEDIFEIKSLNN